MERQNNKMHRDLARDLRKNTTLPEQQLWKALRKCQLNGYRFRRQMVLGRYIADFVCLNARLVIELDGGQHGTGDAIEYDAERTKFLESLDLTVVRYWNHDVLGRTDVVLEHLWQVCIELQVNKG